MEVLWEKLKEVITAVLPITIIVLILHFTLTPMDITFILQFLMGAVLIIIGLAIFLLGVDVSITPVGKELGKTIAKSNKIWVVVLAGLILGFIISIAEPDLHILAGQVENVTGGEMTKLALVFIVSVGIAVLLAVGLIRIVYNFPLYKLLTILYGLVFLLAIFVTPDFLAIAFDASGATTGAMTVPFILALSIGISALKKDSKASEKDSFGLVAIASVGAIMSVLVMNIVAKSDKLTGGIPENPAEEAVAIYVPFIHSLGEISRDVLIALTPIVIIFLIFQKISFKLSKNTVRKVITGFVLAFGGLILFLVGVNAGFMPLGTEIGVLIASLDSMSYLIWIGFILGVVTILAEPAVYVLTKQIEEVTSGYVQRKVVLVTLAIAVGAAVALSMVRIIIPELQLWHYLLPGYILAIVLTYFVPKLFVGMAFDSGGVASGPMTATFILAFTQGAASKMEGADVIIEGFGMIAMVALTPLITLQILGLLFKWKSKKGGLEH